MCSTQYISGICPHSRIHGGLAHCSSRRFALFFAPAHLQQGTSGTCLAGAGSSVTSSFDERPGPRRGRLYNCSFIKGSHVAFGVRSLQSLAFIGLWSAYLDPMIFIIFRVL